MVFVTFRIINTCSKKMTMITNINTEVNMFPLLLLIRHMIGCVTYQRLQSMNHNSNNSKMMDQVQSLYNGHDLLQSKT